MQSKCVACLRDVARGMEYIQSKKVIHGDLKPSNVLFRSGTSDTTPTVSPRTSDRGRHAVATGARAPSVEAEAEDQGSWNKREARGGDTGGGARTSQRAISLTDLCALYFELLLV